MRQLDVWQMPLKVEKPFHAFKDVSYTCLCVCHGIYHTVSDVFKDVVGVRLCVIEGVFHQILSEDKNVELKDVHLSYQNCYRAHGFISVIEKWVNEGFKESDRFIIDTISELDLNTQDLSMYE